MLLWSKGRSYNAAAHTILLDIRIVRATIGRTCRWSGRWTQLSASFSAFANRWSVTSQLTNTYLSRVQVTNVSSGAMLCCLVIDLANYLNPHTQLGPAKPHSLAPARDVWGFGLMRSLPWSPSCQAYVVKKQVIWSRDQMHWWHTEICSLLHSHLIRKKPSSQQR